MYSANFMAISTSDFMFLVSNWEIWPDGGTGKKVKIPSASKEGMKERVWEPLVVLEDRSGVDCAQQVNRVCPNTQTYGREH